MDEQSTQNPQKSEPHGNYQPYGNYITSYLLCLHVCTYAFVSIVTNKDYFMYLCRFNNCVC